MKRLTLISSCSVIIALLTLELTLAGSPYNTAYGANANPFNKGTFNTAIGDTTLSSNNLGFQNTAIRADALISDCLQK